MASFSKFKLLFKIKSNFNGVNYIKKYQNLVISKSGNKSKQDKLSLSYFLNNKPKMAQFLKFKFLYELKFNFSGGQIYK